MTSQAEKNPITIRQLTPRESTDASYSMVFPLDPRGVGTGQLECLTSYMMHLADFHWMMTGSFLRQTLRPLYPTDVRFADTRHSRYFYLANGYGVYAQRLSYAVTCATGHFDARFLTFLPWSDVFDNRGHGLIKQHLDWCTGCWQDDVMAGEKPYVRLAWVAQSVTLCPHHERALHSFCPHCREHQLMVSVLPRPWICQSCGKSLLEDRRGHVLLLKQNKKPFWFATAMERLIERTCARGFSLPGNSLQNALRHLALTHAKGSYQQLSEYTQINVGYLKDWSEGTTRPRFPSFLDLCYRIEVPPDALLLDGPALTSPANWHRTGSPHIVTMRKLAPEQKSRIGKALKKIITENPEPPPLVSDVAEKLSITFTVLNYHFPDEYRILKMRATEWRKYLRTKEGQVRVAHLVKAVEMLIDQGIYPSERQLKQFGYVRPVDLRRPEIIDKLRELQEQHSNLPIEIRARRSRSGKRGIEIRRPHQLNADREPKQ